MFTSDEERRGRHIKVVAVVGEVKVGSARSTDAVEGQLPISWEENHVPLTQERLDWLIETLQAARLQAFGTNLT